MAPSFLLADPEAAGARPHGALAPAAATPVDLLPAELPGVDLAVGLGMCMDSPALYRSLLQVLARAQGHFAGAVRAALAAGDLATACAHAHSARGACGQLGATSAALAAQQLEHAILDGVHADPLRGLAEAFCVQHEALIRSIRERLGARAPE